MFELFHTVRAGNAFAILLPKDERARFIDALMGNSGAATDAFANLRIENAKAFDPKDEAWIMKEVDASVGRRPWRG